MDDRSCPVAGGVRRSETLSRLTDSNNGGEYGEYDVAWAYQLRTYLSSNPSIPRSSPRGPRARTAIFRIQYSTRWLRAIHELRSRR
jgi:hypothetical protein